MTNKRTEWMSFRVTDFEKQNIQSKANNTGVSPAVYLRSLGMNYPLKSMVDQLAVDELIKTRADLGRLGGLLKFALVNKIPLGRSKDEIENLLTDMEDKAMRLLSISEKLL